VEFFRVAPGLVLNGSPIADAADSDEAPVSNGPTTGTVSNLAAGAQGTVSLRVQAE